MAEKLILKLENIVKIFPGVKALDGVNLDIFEGEVHAICGENGAGKSTLMKIIAGAQPFTKGKMELYGQEVEFSSTKEAEEHSIAMVYQEFNMIPELTIAENMFVGRLPKKNIVGIDWKKVNEEAKRILNSLGLDFDVTKKVRNISVAHAQMVEIAKCLNVGAKIIIMDEPTAALSEAETHVLFDLIKDLKSKGISIIYISHRMDEIFSISDRITVLRDGKFVDSKLVMETNYDEIVSMMVGRNISNMYPKREPAQREIIFEANSITTRGVKDVSLHLKKGEILGITGLLGSGAIELSKALYGAIKMKKGEILIGGEVINCSSPSKALRQKVAYVSDDRKNEGLVIVRSVKENIVMASLKNDRIGIHINKKKELSRVRNNIDKLNIKVSSENQLVSKLSGGNQQKVVFAKMLECQPKILILAEPTRGVDVGAKAEIYSILDELTHSGMSIIIISTDLPEVIGLSDRVLVMRAGEIVLELDKYKDKINEEIILANASGGVE